MVIKKFIIRKFNQVILKNTLEIIYGSVRYKSDKSKKLKQQNT